MIIYLLSCFSLVLVDQIIKIICVNKLYPIKSVEIIKNFFKLTYVENRGAAFGIFQGAQFVFILIAIIVSSICLFYLFKSISKKDKKLLKFSLILIISGSVGNLIDRIFRGYVIDMFHFIFWGKSFAVFNIADIFIVLGAFLLVLDTVYKSKTPHKRGE